MVKHACMFTQNIGTYEHIIQWYIRTYGSAQHMPVSARTCETAAHVDIHWVIHNACEH